MLRNYILPAALLAAFAAAVYLGVPPRDRAQRGKPTLVGGLECGHWAVFRVCELMGVPVSPKFLREEMPSGNRGHSLKEIADVLRSAGLIVRGRQETFDTFLAADGIRVLHIASAEHFIVVIRCEGDRVLFLDHRGRRQSLRGDQLRPHWSGNLLYVERPPTPELLGFDRDQVVVGQPRVQFERLFIDKGDLPTKADSASILFEYPFRNTGGADLQIRKIHTTCTCLQSKKPERPIPPGESGVVTLEYSLKDSPATFHHEAVIETNDPRHPALILRAAGNANVLVNVSPQTLALGDVPLGSDHQAFLFVTHTGEDDFDVRGVHSAVGGLTLSTHRTPKGPFADQLWPGSRSRLDLGPRARVVEARFSGQRLGPVKGEVTIQTNIEGFEKITVPVSGTVVPPVLMNPPLLSFGESLPNEGVERAVVFSSMVKKPIEVVEVKCKGEPVDYSAVPSGDDPTRLRVCFTGKGERFHRLSGSVLNVKLASGGARFVVDLPVFAAKKPGS